MILPRVANPYGVGFRLQCFAISPAGCCASKRRNGWYWGSKVYRIRRHQGVSLANSARCDGVRVARVLDTEFEQGRVEWAVDGD